MDKFKHLRKVKKIFQEGGNIIQYLKSLDGNVQNSIEDILISYDFQAGSYVRHYKENKSYYNSYTKEIGKILEGLSEFDSIIEIGVGEATTLNGLVSNLKRRPKDILGLDISWSRLKYAAEFLKEMGQTDIRLFIADLFEIPLMNNSVDLVYTFHSIEPNGGREEDALKELFRITRKYLVLFEPAFELASDEAKNRMQKHGYVTKLHETTIDLGYNIVDYKLFNFAVNPLNPTGVMIIEKMSEEQGKSDYICPVSNTPLEKARESFYFSNDSLLAYPILDEIPCLLKDNAILASHLMSNFSRD